MLIQAGHDRVGLAARVLELLRAAQADFFERLQTIRRKSRTHHRDALACRAKLFERLVRVRLQPLFPSEA